MRHHDRADAPPSDPAEMDLPELLVHLSRSLRSRNSRDLAPFDLTPSQARAFVTVARWQHRAPHPDAAPELRLSTLAELLQIAPRSATELVDALQEKGFVERRASAVDRRAIVVTLSAAGVELRRRMRLAREQSDRRTADGLFSVLQDEERNQLEALLRKVAAADRTAVLDHPTSGRRAD